MNESHDSCYDKGLAMRRQVMGNEFVDKALSGTTDFTRPLQEHITAKAWGDVWQRPGLDLKTRCAVRSTTVQRRPSCRKCCCMRPFIAAFLRRSRPFAPLPKWSSL